MENFDELSEEVLIRKAKEELGLENYANALIIFSKILELNPKNLRVLILKANLQNNTGDYQGAIDSYSELIKLVPHNESIWSLRGDAKEKIADYKGAINDWSEGIKLDPDNFQRAINEFSNEIKFEIKGNEYTDTQVILSLLDKIPDSSDNNYSNQIIIALNESNLFSEVEVKYLNNIYVIYLKEFPNIDKIYFTNNDRLKDEELDFIVSEINLKSFNKNNINSFINEVKKIYESFGYNDVKINYTEKYFEETNTVDIYFDINEGKLLHSRRKVKQAISKKFLLKSLTDYLDDSQEVEKITNFILESRETKETDIIRRKINK